MENHSELNRREGLPWWMAKIIKSDVEDPRVLEVEASPEEITEVFRYRNDGSLIGSEWRPKAGVIPTG